MLTLWQQSSGAFATDQPGLHHLSFEVDSVEAVQAAEARVREAGLRLYHDGIVPHGEGASSGGIFFEDPDGIRLEIFTGAGRPRHRSEPGRPDLRLLLGRCRATTQGELAVQTRAGVADRAAAMEDAFETEVPPVAAEFLAAQPWIVLGAADAHDRMWATVLYGRPGFITTPVPSTVHIAAHPLAGDPLEGALTGPVGGLAIEPGTRRRMRLNGQAWSDRRRRVDRARAGLLELPEVHRDPPRHRRRALPLPSATRASRSTRAATDLLARADTAFVATRGPDGGVDASHRGGNPGFLRVVDAHTIVWPDYAGNSMFNTLGNIAVDPATGLTVVDP